MLFNSNTQTLYIRDVKDVIRTWTIFRDGSDIVILHGVQNGAMQEVRETIAKGKAARSLDEQIESRMNSRINKQLLKGYKKTLEEAFETRTNMLGFFKPMLAQSLSKMKNPDLSQSYVQAKYDGNRCLITKHNGQMIAYSRNGKLINTIGHILNGINIPEGLVLDGELYCHGYTLQEIVSWIKRKQADTYRLQYHVYDLIHPAVFSERLERLQDIDYGEAAQLVPTTHFSKIKSLRDEFKEIRTLGYEGLILRLDQIQERNHLKTVGYEDGKRSKSLIKMKEFLDDEFPVVEIEKSEKNRTVVTCLARNGKTFKVSPPGKLPERLKVYDEYEKYIGQSLRIEYSVLTPVGIPFHGVATEWRNKEDE